MRQKKSAVTPQKYPTYNGIWNALLYRKYFELQLMKHAGLPLRRSTHKYGRFRYGENKFLGSQMLKNSTCIERVLTLTVLPSFKTQTETFLRQVIIQEDSLEILADHDIIGVCEVIKGGGL
jgi:hypothetical protein